MSVAVRTDSELEYCLSLSRCSEQKSFDTKLLIPPSSGQSFKNVFFFLKYSQPRTFPCAHQYQATFGSRLISKYGRTATLQLLLEAQHHCEATIDACICLLDVFSDRSIGRATIVYTTRRNVDFIQNTSKVETSLIFQVGLETGEDRPGSVYCFRALFKKKS